MPGEREFWLRFAVGSAVVVATIAAATAAYGLVLFERVADELEPIPGLVADESPDLGPDAVAGNPYTILLLGSDRRPNRPDERSDTTMLVRLDPDRDVLSLLSLPRDLRTYIPGVGSDKLNAAYTAGGPKLTLETVSDLTGVEINDVVDVDFQGFAEAVNAIDCVYFDVDREYYVPPGSGFAEIDVNAGYQRLCGLKALQFVRFRHTDNDIVRSARQQAFLREARQRLSLGKLVLGGGGKDLLTAFTSNTRSTIEDGGELRSLAETLYLLRGASVEQIQVVGDLGPEEIAAGYGEIDRKVDKFLGRTAGRQGGDGVEQRASPPDRLSAGKRRQRRRDREAARELEPADPQFERYAQTATRRLGIPAYYPTGLAAGSRFVRDSRTYEYEDSEGERQAAYKLVVSRPHDTIATEHYGFTGTSWDDPPILRNPSETRSVGDRELLVFYAGDRVRLVGWKQGGNSYWLSNSLLLSLSEREMIAIATGMLRT